MALEPASFYRDPRVNMTVLHDTPFLADDEDLRDSDGSHVRLMVLKATFEIGKNGNLTPSENQRPIAAGPVWLGEPGRSSLIEDGDWALKKPSADIAIVGHIRPPHCQPVRQLLARFSIGHWTKTVRVVGDRPILAGAFTMQVGDPLPFTSMPIMWERSFGGTSADGRQHRCNPIGRGLVDRKDLEDADGRFMPNFENPELPSRINGGESTGLGFIDCGWEPRIHYAGTYDEDWIRHRMPLFPKDFDHRFFNASPPDMVYPGHLKGGEIGLLEGCCPDGPLKFTLPRMSVYFAGKRRSGIFECEAVMDTLLLDLDRLCLSCVWRAKVAIAANEREYDVRAEVTLQD